MRGNGEGTTERPAGQTLTDRIRPGPDRGILGRDVEYGMANPEFLICLNCETPCYTFDWKDGRILEPFCAVCANDDADQFALEEDFEAMAMDGVSSDH